MSAKKYPKYSILMSVYAKEKPEWLQFSIESILKQNVKPNEFVIVEDGVLPKELNAVINNFTIKHKNLFNVIKLKKNIGLGPALKVGIENCHNELIARMDSDDYSVPERIEEQLKILEKNPNLDIIGSTVNEFEDDIKHTISIVSLPEKHDDIINYAKKRCPFRHPSLLYKKTAVINAGNYRDYHLCEDYDLYTRMLQNGSKCYNIQQPLTYMRVDKNFYKRRGGIKYLKSIIKFKKEQLQIGFITKKDFTRSTIAHVIVCLIPNALRRRVYRSVLRRQEHGN